jgi:hypothetical protein
MNLSSGDAGTVVAAGTSPVTQTPTGRSLLEFDEFTILVSGLSIDLPPGTYWLSVTPHGVGGSEASLNSVTRGLNALGSPPGNDGNSFLDSAPLAADFAALDEIFFPAPDFSMGVAGSVLGAQVVPEPASIVLTALGLAGLACASMTRKSRTLGPDTRTCKRERTLFRTQIATAPTLKNPTASSRRAADQTSSIGELAISEDPERREGHGCASRTGDEVRPRDFT